MFLELIPISGYFQMLEDGRKKFSYVTKMGGGGNEENRSNRPHFLKSDLIGLTKKVLNIVNSQAIFLFPFPCYFVACSLYKACLSQGFSLSPQVSKVFVNLGIFYLWQDINRPGVAGSVLYTALSFIN